MTSAARPDKQPRAPQTFKQVKARGRQKEFLEELAAFTETQRTLIEAEVSGFTLDPSAQAARVLQAQADFRFFAKTYLPHYIKGAESVFCAEPSNPSAVNASSDGRQILTMMFRAAQQSGEIHAEPAADQLAMNFEYLLFAAINAWLADAQPDLSERFLSAFDLLMYGVAIQQGWASNSA